MSGLGAASPPSPRILPGDPLGARLLGGARFPLGKEMGGVKRRILLRWFLLNLLFFASFFLLMWALVAFFPEGMLRFFGRWTALMRAAGAKSREDFCSPADMFAHIVRMNGITAALYLAIGLLLQSPLVMAFTGAFYALVGFLAPFTLGRPFGWHDWLLVSVEALALTLSLSLSSALGGDWLGVRPELGSLADYWRRHWNKLFPQPVNRWRAVLKAWRGTALLAIGVIAALLLFAAWFETYGC